MNIKTALRHLKLLMAYKLMAFLHRQMLKESGFAELLNTGIAPIESFSITAIHAESAYRCECCNESITQDTYYHVRKCSNCVLGQCRRRRLPSHDYYPLKVRRLFGRCAKCGHDMQVMLKWDKVEGGLFQEDMYLIKEIEEHHIVHYTGDKPICDSNNCECADPQTAEVLIVNKNAYQQMADSKKWIGRD
jgi:hypothetical protein